MGGNEPWYSRMMRPAVQVSEQVNTESNWKLPKLKAWLGIPVSIMLIGIGLVWSLWITPPDVAVDVATIVFFLGGAASFTYGVFKRGLMEENSLIAFYGFAATTFWAMLIWRVRGSGSYAALWWGRSAYDNALLLILQYVAGLALMGGGGAGLYWFVKEIITPYELTGRDRVALEMWRGEQRATEAAQTNQNTWHIEARIEDDVGRKKTTYLSFDVKPANFATWARNILEMKSPDLTYEKWAGKGKLFTRPEYDDITEELVSRGVLVKEGQARNAPLALTRAGRALLGEWLNEYDECT